VAKTEPKKWPPYDLPASQVPCVSRLHWRKNKLAALKQQLFKPMKAVMLDCIEGEKIKKILDLWCCWFYSLSS